MRKSTTLAAPSGIVQVIHVSWSKSARGGEAARERNSVPHSLAVPTDDLIGSGGNVYSNISHWGERNSFAEPGDTLPAIRNGTFSYKMCQRRKHKLLWLPISAVSRCGGKVFPRMGSLSAIGWVVLAGKT